MKDKEELYTGRSSLHTLGPDATPGKICHNLVPGGGRGDGAT